MNDYFIILKFIFYISLIIRPDSLIRSKKQSSPVKN